MAEPARQLDPSQNQSAQPSGSNQGQSADNVVDLNQYKQEQNIAQQLKKEQRANQQPKNQKSGMGQKLKEKAVKKAGGTIGKKVLGQALSKAGSSVGKAMGDAVGLEAGAGAEIGSSMGKSFGEKKGEQLGIKASEKALGPKNEKEQWQKVKQLQTQERAKIKQATPGLETPDTSPKIEAINEESSFEDYDEALNESLNKESHLLRLRAKAAAAIAKYDVSKYLIATILAVFLDAFDIIIEATGAGIFLFVILWAFKILIIFIIFFFLMGKGYTKMKLSVIKFVLIEFIPILALAPIWTLAVIWAWIKVSKKKDEAFFAFTVIDAALEGTYQITKRAKERSE
jgi:hypothetical protein